MRSSVLDILPPKVLRSLKKLGHDLSIARRRRRLSIDMMTERLCISKATYLRLEKGDPTVSIGVYAMTLYVLGFGNALNELADAGKDQHGLLLEDEHLPKRIRAKKDPTPL